MPILNIEKAHIFWYYFFLIHLLLFSHQEMNKAQFSDYKINLFSLEKNRGAKEITKNNICLEGTR